MTTTNATILVTFDGSDASRAVFQSAAQLARQMQATILLLRVHQAPPEVWVHPDAAHREAEIARLTAQWEQDLTAVASGFAAEAGVTVEPVSRLLGQRWNAASEILAVAEEYDVALICMATHGQGSVRRFFIGSTALDVLAQSKRPVTLVRV